MTQAQQVHDYINTYGSITVWEAFMDLGITQLGRCIDDIKKAGVTIAREPIKVKTRMGKKCTIKRYHFEPIQRELL